MVKGGWAGGGGGLENGREGRKMGKGGWRNEGGRVEK